MKSMNKELYVGVFVLIGLLCAGYLTIVLGGVPMFQPPRGIRFMHIFLL